MIIYARRLDWYSRDPRCKENFAFLSTTPEVVDFKDFCAWHIFKQVPKEVFTTCEQDLALRIEPNWHLLVIQETLPKKPLQFEFLVCYQDLVEAIAAGKNYCGPMTDAQGMLATRSFGDDYIPT